MTLHDVVLTTSTGEEVTVATPYPALTRRLYADGFDISIIEQIIASLKKYFATSQEMVCFLLEFFPEAEASLDVNVSDACKLRYKVQKL